MVVLMWATLAVLGGVPLKAIEHGSVADEDPAATAGVGVCTVAVALLFGTGAKRLREVPRFCIKRVWRLEGLRAARPVACEKPPPAVPPLELLPILRT